MCLFLRLSSYSKINPLHTCACLVLARFNHVCMRLVSFKTNAVLGSFGDFFPFCIYMIVLSLFPYQTTSLNCFRKKTKPQLWFVSQIIETTTKKGEIFSLFFSLEAQQITEEWFAVVWGLFFGSLVEAQLLENGRE